MRTQTILSMTGLTLLTGVVGYAVYFDYKRRNDPAFRSALRKDKKKTHKALKKQSENHKKEVAAAIEDAVRSVNEPGALPSGVEDKERIFMQSVQQGEILLAQGSQFYIQAAKSFFRAFKVYPQPIELIGIYQKAVPDEVFNIIMEMVAKDAAINGGGPSAPASMDPFAALAAAARGAPTSSSLEEIDDDSPANKGSTPPSGTSSTKGSASAPSVSSGEMAGETSSQEWEKVSKDGGEHGAEPARAAAATATATSSSVEEAREVGQSAHELASGSRPETAPAAAPNPVAEETVSEEGGRAGD